jgi:uncharacterized membrane protein YwaF
MYKYNNIKKAKTDSLYLYISYSPVISVLAFLMSLYLYISYSPVISVLAFFMLLYLYIKKAKTDITGK